MYKIKYSYNVGNEGGVFIKYANPEELHLVLNGILDIKGVDNVELYYEGHKCTLPDWYENTLNLKINIKGDEK